jgi:hypothetical protein
MEFIAGIAAMSDSGALVRWRLPRRRRQCRSDARRCGRAVLESYRSHPADGSEAYAHPCAGTIATRCIGPRRARIFLPSPRFATDRRIGADELSLDCWLYHPQIPELTAVADAFPNLTIILNHTGTPILGGPYRDSSTTFANNGSRR